MHMGTTTGDEKGSTRKLALNKDGLASRELPPFGGKTQKLELRCINPGKYRQAPQQFHFGLNAHDRSLPP